MKPMLAVEAGDDIKFPVYASPKLDGIRAVIKDGKPMSRSLKIIPNKYVQSVLSNPLLNGLDGELVVGPPNAQNVMQSTTSGVMSYEGEPEFTFWVFDYWTSPQTPFNSRLETLRENLARLIVTTDVGKHVEFLDQVLISTQEELDQYESYCLSCGYEGIMIRSPEGEYKYGRSTLRQGYLLKVKRFTDGEAIVTGFEELMHNANEAKVDNLGYTERSTCKANLEPMGTLGSLLVTDIETGIEFKIGTGFDAAKRQEIWDNKGKYIQQIAKYKHFANAGVKEKPRFPVWLGFRHKEDM